MPPSIQPNRQHRHADVGAAWKRRDRFKRTYLYVSIRDGNRLRTYYLFPNVDKHAEHQPDYRVVPGPPRP